MKYRRRKMDGNQPEIVKALREIGCSIVDLSAVGGGTPDLLCGLRGRNWLLEVKQPERIGKKPRGKFQIETEKRQADFRKSWQGQVATVSTAADAVATISGRSVGAVSESVAVRSPISRPDSIASGA